ncbi:hypothetical protein AAFF_G00239600 [Aldrovandia affinis]|uniref:Uncharacterized protein n=1 Tax=Aldrovandia affinis TaxID=143900 RepID=A0AAD7RDW3_9TELE|nr:hypothetical protein AAFF_G00239600 [Aldrovandia affinis]
MDLILAKHEMPVWLKVFFEVRADNVYAEELTFGSGTHLTVTPKGSPKDPFLSILTGNSEQSSVCLATGFFPKTGSMNLTTKKGQNDPISTDSAVLTSDKTYFFAAISKKGEAIQRCSLNGFTAEIASETDNDQEKAMEKAMECEPQPTAENSTMDHHQILPSIIIERTDYPKVNFICRHTRTWDIALWNRTVGWTNTWLK